MFNFNSFSAQIFKAHFLVIIIVFSFEFWEGYFIRVTFTMVTRIPYIIVVAMYLFLQIDCEYNVSLKQIIICVICTLATRIPCIIVIILPMYMLISVLLEFDIHTDHNSSIQLDSISKILNMWRKR